jgi:hypothetical protein
VKKVGEKKQLIFEGLITKGDQPEPVGAGAGSSPGEDAGAASE